MSTRCNVHFDQWRDTQANIYVHSDGYPDGEHGIPARLERFFTEVKENVSDNRFNDAEYLAAKFLVWQAREYTVTRCEWKRDKECAYHEPKKDHYLDFLSIAPVLKDHSDIEYVYTVNCDEHDERGFPKVTWTKVTWK